MSIGFDKNTSENTSKFIVINEGNAINENRYLEELSSETNDSGVSYLEVTIRDRTGATANRRYYEPKIGGFINDEKDLNKAIGKVTGVTAGLVRRFKGEDYAITAETWKEYFNKVVSTIKGIQGWREKELRVKIVYNKDGFPTLPGYPPVFEDPSIPRSESKLSITPYDVVNPVKIEPDTDISDSSSENDVDF